MIWTTIKREVVLHPALLLVLLVTLALLLITAPQVLLHMSVWGPFAGMILSFLGLKWFRLHPEWLHPQYSTRSERTPVPPFPSP